MEGNKTTDNSKKSVNKSQRNAKSEAEIKIELEKEIRELNSLVSRLECRIERSKFRDAKIVTSSDNFDAPLKDKIINVDARLKNELYRFAGFYCVKCTEDEYIFNFSPSYKYEKENTFAVQILNVNGKGTLGKWVMPMSVDLDELKSKYKIKNLNNILPFLRACKNYIDCHYSRLEQFQELTNNISGAKNCSLQSNLGYTQFILEFEGVHNVEKNFYMNLIVYLMYNAGETRPFKIKFESKREDELDEVALKCLKSCLKSFKHQDLNSAFEQIFSGNSDKFVWSRETNEDSPIELSNLSNSEEEGFLEQFVVHGQSSMLSRKRKQRIQRRKKRTMQTNVKDLVNSSKTGAKSVRLRNIKTRSQNLNSIPLNTEKEPITETPNAVPVTSTQPKQRKLTFQLDQDQISNKTNNAISSEDLSKRSTSKNTAPQLFTSTPYHSSTGNTFKLIASTSCDISDIAMDDNIPRRITKHKNVVQPDKGQRNDKDNEQISRPGKLKRPKNNTNIKSFMVNVQKKK